MLKWTVMNKRNSTSLKASTTTRDTNIIKLDEETSPPSNHQQSNMQRHPPTTTCSTQRRRHSLGKDTNRRHSGHKPRRQSTSGMKLNNRNNKENQFTSTPKSKDSISYFRFDTIVLRDVSNITPTSTPPNKIINCNKRCRSQPHENKCLSVRPDLKLTFTPPSRRSCHPPSRKKLCLRDSDCFEDKVKLKNEFNERNVSKSFCKPFDIPPLSKNILTTYPGKLIVGECEQMISNLNDFKKKNFQKENQIKNVNVDKLLDQNEDTITNEIMTGDHELNEKYIVEGALTCSTHCIEKPLPGSVRNTYASTLPTFQIEYSPCPIRTTQSVLGIKNNKTTLPPYHSLATLPNVASFLYTDSAQDIEDKCPPNKRTKIDHVNDFLNHISLVTSPEDIGMQFTEFKRQCSDLKSKSNVVTTVTLEQHDKANISKNINCIEESEVNSNRNSYDKNSEEITAIFQNVWKHNPETPTKECCSNSSIHLSPLTSRLAELKFHKISQGKTISLKKDNSKNDKMIKSDNSTDESQFDNLSLEKMVEAILDTTEIPNNDLKTQPHAMSTPSRKDEVEKQLQVHENHMNETQEDNFVNIQYEKDIKSNSKSSTIRSLVNKTNDCVGSEKTEKLNSSNSYKSKLLESNDTQWPVNCEYTSSETNLIQSANIVKVKKCDPVVSSSMLDFVSIECFNEREVKTPDNKLNAEIVKPSPNLEINFENIHISSEAKRKIRKRAIEGKADGESQALKNESDDNLEASFHLKRQRCVRRKKTLNNKDKCYSDNQLCGLTLQNGIPSPQSSCKSVNKNNSMTKDNVNNVITVEQTYTDFKKKRYAVSLSDSLDLTPKQSLNIDAILNEKLEETPLNLFPGYRKHLEQSAFVWNSKDTQSDVFENEKKSNENKCNTNRFGANKHFGLTLPNGIPSLSCSDKKNHNNPFNFLSPDRREDYMGTPHSEAWNTSDEPKLKSRRCLTFTSPDFKKVKDCDRSTTPEVTPFRSRSKENLLVKGSIELNVKFDNGKLLVHVIQCKDLYRIGGKPINAYVKVSLVRADDSAIKERCAGLQRTAVHRNSNKPHFDQVFTFDISQNDLTKRVQLTVWHRDRHCRRSEFLGCTTLAVKHAVKKEISGSFRLLPQSTGRSQNIQTSNNSYVIPTIQTLSTNQACEEQKSEYNETLNVNINNPNKFILIEDKQTETDNLTNILSISVKRASKMGDRSQSSIEEVISLDEAQDIVTHDLNKPATLKTKLSEQQRVADENIFLRYLELDPTEGPEAIPAALQRKAIGNKSGRTPFTTTKRLTRPPDSGFGFSVVWTHPPRVERVEKGLPADRAGILPGDFIIFVDKDNVVMMPEVDVLNLIRSYGNQLILEIFRRNSSTLPSSTYNGLVPSSQSPSVTIITPGSNLPVGTLSTIVPPPSGNYSHQHPRSSTACSTNTASDYNRRRLHLPQVTFSSEQNTTNIGPDETRKRAMFQLIHREQQYSTAMQFSMSRFVAPLAERTDLLAPSDHRALFQNAEDLLHLTEEILDGLVPEDGDVHISLIPKVYCEKLSLITSFYKRYCSGLKKADCILANKTRNTNSEFVRFLHNPAIPRRRPDITGFIHKPLEHYREVLKLLQTILTNTKSNSDDYQMLSKIVQELQITYREITSSAGLMEPVGEGRPLLSIQDLESRLVFTRCKPFVLNIPGRQWIFGGDLSRIEGRNIRPYWVLLFSDILLFAKVSRDRVLFITEEPLPLINISDVFFNIRKKATEFRINIDNGGKPAESPTAHCGPDLSRTPKKNTRRRCVALRAPTTELKAVWQNLLQKQIYIVHSNIGGTPFSSPLDSPDAPITSSVATLQSADSYGCRRQTSQISNDSTTRGPHKQLDELIEHKCLQLGKSGTNKGSALHLAQWMKGQLGASNTISQSSPDEEEVTVVWTEEELRRRSRELHLVDIDGSLKNKDLRQFRPESRCESVLLSDIDGSPSKSPSTTSGSQVTVRSSPIVPENVPVCRQCHRTCLSANNNHNLNIHNTNNNIMSQNNCKNQDNCKSNINCNKSNSNSDQTDVTNGDDPYNDDWGSLMLMGLTAINPTTALLKMDPFAPSNVPKISILPPTPDTLPRSASDETSQFPLTCDNNNCQISTPKNSPKRKLQSQDNIDNEDDDDSPQTEEPPYLVMVPKNPGLKRYGTWSSLGRIPSDELVEAPDNIDDDNSSSEEEEEDSEEEEDEDEEDEDTSHTSVENNEPIVQSIRGWTARAGSFVAEKMALFEKLGEDSRAAIDRYLRPAENAASKQDADTDGGTLSSGGIDEEYENSGATSGEEVWGTPTSGGEFDDLPVFPNSHGDTLSSPQDSNSSANYDDEDLIMDELLMAPPITAASVRGLLPRRRLEPLLEEDDTESCTTTSAPNNVDTTPSPEQGSESGGVADISSAAVSLVDEKMSLISAMSKKDKTPPVLPLSINPTDGLTNDTGTPSPPVADKNETKGEEVSNPKPERLARASSYKHIVEEESSLFSRISTTRTSFSRKITSTHASQNRNIETPDHVTIVTHRSKSARLLEFLSGRSTSERRHEETITSSTNGNRHILKIFSKDSSESVNIPSYSRPFSPRRQTDKQLDRRFWKQLRRRRRNLTTQIPAV